MSDDRDAAWEKWHDDNAGSPKDAFFAGWDAALAQEQTVDKTGTTSGSFDRAWRPAPPRAYKTTFGFGLPEVSA